MASVDELHAFYQANLPGYKRADVLKVTRAFLDIIGWPKKRPYASLIGEKWEIFKYFVCEEWQGEEIREPGEKPPEVTAPVSIDHGRCKCGGQFVKRQNRTYKNFFLGCSNYPKCKNTKYLNNETV